MVSSGKYKIPVECILSVICDPHVVNYTVIGRVMSQMGSSAGQKTLIGRRASRRPRAWPRVCDAWETRFSPGLEEWKSEYSPV